MVYDLINEACTQADVITGICGVDTGSPRYGLIPTIKYTVSI